MSPKVVDRKLRYIKAYKDRHGKARYYYRRAGTSTRIEGEFGTPEWLDSYTKIHERFGKPTGPTCEEGTFDAAVQAYYESDRFAKLKPNTKYNYRKALAAIQKGIGRAQLTSITRGVIVQIRDQIAKSSPRRAVEAVKVFKLVFERACDLDMMEHNPAAKVSNPVSYKSKPHAPWSQEEIGIFVAGAAPVWRRAFMLLLHTGLRRDDAINLTRDHIINGRICLTKETTGQTTRKTGAEVVVPITAALAEELARPLPIANVDKLLITGTRGRKIRGDVLTHSIAKEAKRLGIAKPPPLHGLRKNAVMTLIEHGLSPEQIHAITGQSHEMIKHYGQEYDRHRLVDQAVIKLEPKP